MGGETRTAGTQDPGSAAVRGGRATCRTAAAGAQWAVPDWMPGGRAMGFAHSGDAGGSGPGRGPGRRTPHLLRSKLSPPLAGSSIERVRLDEWVTRLLDSRLTVIQAPAGFGKTTVMLQLVARLEEREVRTSWLTLDEADNDAGRFLAYLAGALARDRSRARPRPGARPIRRLTLRRRDPLEAAGGGHPAVGGRGRPPGRALPRRLRGHPQPRGARHPSTGGRQPLAAPPSGHRFATGARTRPGPHARAGAVAGGGARRPPLRLGRDRELPAHRPGPRPGRRGTRPTVPMHRGVGRRAAALGAGDRRERRPAGGHRFVLGVVRRHRRLPGRGRRLAPTRARARLPAQDQHPRPPVGQPVRDRHRLRGQPRAAVVPGARQPVPQSPRRGAAMVPLPQPVRRVPARPGGTDHAERPPRAARTGGRLVRRRRPGRRGGQARPGRRRPRPGRRIDGPVRDDPRAHRSAAHRGRVGRPAAVADPRPAPRVAHRPLLGPLHAPRAREGPGGARPDRPRPRGPDDRRPRHPATRCTRSNRWCCR